MDETFLDVFFGTAKNDMADLVTIKFYAICKMGCRWEFLLRVNKCKFLALVNSEILSFKEMRE